MTCAPPRLPVLLGSLGGPSQLGREEGSSFFCCSLGEACCGAALNRERRARPSLLPQRAMQSGWKFLRGFPVFAKS